MREIKTEVCVLGAGPGGVCTAIALSQAGINSVLVDKSIFPRDKVCGDALSGKVVEVLNSIDRGIVSRLFREDAQVGSWGVRFFAPNRQELRVPFKSEINKNDSPPGFISKRKDFDHFMVKELRNHDRVTFFEGVEITEFDIQENGVICSNKEKDIRIKAELVIAADGAHSKFAKNYGNIKKEKEHYCAGVRTYYKGVTQLDEDNFIELHFLKDLIPGYFWIFPLPDGLANVGLGIRSDYVSKKRLNLKDLLQNAIATNPQISKRFENAECLDKIQGYGLPLGSKKRSISGDRFMLVGDAASLIDPFTGEGIGNAMLSGVKAAECARKALLQQNFSSTFLKQYDKAVYNRLWKELSLSRRLQQLANYPRLFNFVVNKANRNHILKETISNMFENIDLRSKLKQPSFYLNLLFN